MAFQLLTRIKKTGGKIPANPITIVSGLPRSGTSMMMKMLEAGGMEVVTDHIRIADESNPKGYYEFERVKKLKDGDNAWLESAGGKAVKVISAILEHLPAQYEYRLIFMLRNIDEVLASQKQMLVRRGEPTDKVSDEKLKALFQEHLSKVEAWLAGRSNFKVLYVSYNDILKNPQENIERIHRFTGGILNTGSMREAVDAGLYRQRKPGA